MDNKLVPKVGMTYKINLEKTQDEITNTINELVNHMQHSGSVLVATNKKTIYKKCFGYADISKKVSVSMDTQFLVGSVTKQFTAVAILKALLDRNINKNGHAKFKDHIQAELNNTVEHYLPADHEIWNDSMPAWANTVTIHQLLVHSSGITNYTSLPYFEKQKFPKNSDLVTFFKKHKLEFKPGEKFSYSNSGYYLLGIIIQQITQQNLDIYLKKTFFEPFEMRSTFFPTQGTVDDLIRSDARFVNLARGYQYEISKPNASLEEVNRYESMEIPGAAGSLISTAKDMLKWNNALYTGKIIPKFLLELLLKPYLVTERVDAFYGYGIEIMKSDVFGEYYSHRGGIPGFRSILTFIPSLQISIIALQNIVSNQEKIMPEIEKIKAELPQTFSQEKGLQELIKIIESKYPSIIENRKRYELAPIYDEIIKTLESICLPQIKFEKQK
jgi:CubicO group peptidase (beta-lactamase class C family)